MPTSRGGRSLLLDVHGQDLATGHDLRPVEGSLEGRAGRDSSSKALLSRPSPFGVLSLVIILTTWAAFAAAQAERGLPVPALAASPSSVAHGRLWLLFSSGLLVQRPFVLSIVSFVLFAIVALVVCGTRVLWVAMAVGHVGSTLLAYGLLAAMRLPDLAVNQSWETRDYGVSAIVAAWLGAIACVAWRRRGSSNGEKSAVALACVAIGLFAWMAEQHAQRHLTFLDSEHVIAFALGVLIVRRPRISVLRLSPVRSGT